MTHPFPPSFVTAESDLIDVFFDEAVSLGITGSVAEELLRAIPSSVRTAKAAKFALGPDWRYIYGKRFVIGGTSRGFGIPHQAPLVVNLIRATALAKRHLNPSQFRHWWQVLEMPGKHLDAIVEMLSVSSVSPDAHLAYE